MTGICLLSKYFAITALKYFTITKQLGGQTTQGVAFNYISWKFFKFNFPKFPPSVERAQKRKKCYLALPV